MFPLARAVGTALIAVVLASVAGNALAYLGWASAWRRRDTTCELLDDEAPPPWPARALAWLGVYLRECAATVMLVVTAPLAFGRERLRGAGDPVVVVTGWLQHRGHLASLARRLRRGGRAVVVTSPPGHDLESRAAALAETIERIRHATGAPHLEVVAVGTGGLVARAAIRLRGQRGGVVRLVTLGTPHQGTSAFAWLGRVTRVLRPGSPLLHGLAADDPVPALADCISIYSTDDAFILPHDAAYYGGAFNIEVRGVGHLWLAYSGRIHELIRENLGTEAAGNDDKLRLRDTGGGR